MHLVGFIVRNLSRCTPHEHHMNITWTSHEQHYHWYNNL